MVDVCRDFWIRETGTGQQVAQLRNRYMMMMMIKRQIIIIIVIIIIIIIIIRITLEHGSVWC